MKCKLFGRNFDRNTLLNINGRHTHTCVILLCGIITRGLRLYFALIVSPHALLTLGAAASRALSLGKAGWAALMLPTARVVHHTPALWALAALRGLVVAGQSGTSAVCDAFCVIDTDFDLFGSQT